MPCHLQWITMWFLSFSPNGAPFERWHKLEKMRLVRTRQVVPGISLLRKTCVIHFSLLHCFIAEVVLDLCHSQKTHFGLSTSAKVQLITPHRSRAFIAQPAYTRLHWPGLQTSQPRIFGILCRNTGLTVTCSGLCGNAEIWLVVS